MNITGQLSLWKAGRITGWMEALMEHFPPTLRSFLPEEQMTVLQEVEKNSLEKWGTGNGCLFPGSSAQRAVR